MIDLGKLTWTQLDTKKCNLVVIHVPENFTSLDVDYAREMVSTLTQFGVMAGIIVPPGWEVEFAEAERKEEQSDGAHVDTPTQ